MSEGTKRVPATAYVASASEQYALVEHFVDRLREAGVEVTFEWTPDVRAAGFKPDAELSSVHRRYIARMDACGVREAELTWVLTPSLKEHGCGMWVEMGIALALGRRVVVSGPLSKRTVFSELAEAVFASHEEAFDYITSLSKAA